MTLSLDPRCLRLLLRRDQEPQGAGFVRQRRSPSKRASTEKDFVKQTWRGSYQLREILNAGVTPLLPFTDAFARGRLFVRGVRVLPLEWLVGEILGARDRHARATFNTAANVLADATGCSRPRRRAPRE